jgi:hypothetical protein
MCNANAAYEYCIATTANGTQRLNKNLLDNKIVGSIVARKNLIHD